MHSAAVRDFTFICHFCSSQPCALLCPLQNSYTPNFWKTLIFLQDLPFHPFVPVKIFAPNIEQRDVVNHLKGSPAEEKRNVLVESARLARGNIQDLAELKASEFDAVIFPGGFGVAKNLCSWAVDGKDCTVNEHVNSTLQAFHSAKKPIGLCCISPVLAAKVFPGCEVTVGQDKNVDGRFPDAETASAIAELGCKHVCKNVNESHVDKANKIVTTCAFMCKAPLHEIFDGIGTMVQEVLKLA
nr:ES1 protein homolog, mitochondrial isoform X2 [Columba livia]